MPTLLRGAAPSWCLSLLGVLLVALLPVSRAHARPLMSLEDAGATSATSVYVGVPMFLDVDRDIVRPGFSLDGRFAIDWHYVALDFEVGYQGNAVDGQAIDPPPFDREPLRRIHTGIGLRLQIPNQSRVLPYVSALFDFAWWNLFETQINVGGGVIYAHPDWNFAPGFSGRAGMAIRAKGDIYVDLALGFGMSFPGGFFDQNRYWLSPQLGFTYRR